MYIFIQNFTFSSTFLAYLVAAYLFFLDQTNIGDLSLLFWRQLKKISKAFNNIRNLMKADENNI